ncbi:MAG TPA: hypothetical protein VKJ65_12465, partial [Phycisphaerae bacterium]|nr:hypothetical protein [Phycisphaerae bacterium]
SIEHGPIILHRLDAATKRKSPMADYILVRHKVRDFSEWERNYEAFQSKRTEAGLTQKHLLRSTGNPNEIVVLFEVADVARARTFAESSDLRRAMLQAGLVEKPDVYFLKD